MMPERTTMSVRNSVSLRAAFDRAVDAAGKLFVPANQIESFTVLIDVPGAASFHPTR